MTSTYIFILRKVCTKYLTLLWFYLAAAAAKLLQSCPTLCDPIDASPSGSPVPGIFQARTLEWVAISFSDVWKWKVKVKSLSHVRLLATPWTAAYQAPPSMGFSRQEYWSGVPLPHLTILQIVQFDYSTYVIFSIASDIFYLQDLTISQYSFVLFIFWLNTFKVGLFIAEATRQLLAPLEIKLTWHFTKTRILKMSLHEDKL